MYNMVQSNWNFLVGPKKMSLFITVLKFNKAPSLMLFEHTFDNQENQYVGLKLFLLL
jgi:hypothetical protein